MSNPNIGWLFYKDYYSDLSNDEYILMVASKEEKKERKQELEKISKDIDEKIKNIIASEPILKEEELLGSTRFQATTTYPGLLLGSGNTHELPDVKGQAILGFHFDYTSGLPVIQGSSIKGVLRSAFKHAEYINEYVDVDVKALKTEIFDNADVFFDATIIKADDFKRVLGDDFITPHNDPFKDPIPLRFIKVLPNVTFLFQFELCDGLISKGDKERLFRKILEDLGLGAKTNVGYGKFNISDAPKTEAEIEVERIAKEKEEADKKAKAEADREKAKAEKETKKQDGLNALLDCKTLAEGFKLLKDSFGKKPKPTSEEKEIIHKFMKGQKKLSKSDVKTFGKYGV